MELHKQWNINRTDIPEQIAAKIRSVINEKAPDLTEAQKETQAELGWNGIRAEWGWNNTGNPLRDANFKTAWAKAR